MHVYELRPRKDKRGVDLISDALPFGRLWYAGPDAVNDAIDYAKHRSRSHLAAIRVYDDAGNVIETHLLHVTTQLRKTAPPTSAVLEQIRENATRSILNSETKGRLQ